MKTVEEWMESTDVGWVPKVVTYRVYIQKRGAEEELARVDRTELLSAAFNIAVPDEVFELDLPEHTYIAPRD